MVDIKSTVKTVFLGLFFMAITNIAHAATITATVDRQQINEGESFQLTLEVKGDADDNPDFSPLERNFEILSRNKSSNMQIINGKISSKLIWALTLMPKQKGQISIPPIAFGTDHSNSIKLTVSQAQSSQPDSVAQDMFLQVTADPKQTHVQAQVIYTIRVYIATNITNASLSEPGLSDADAVVKKLGEDRRFETTYQNRRYQVVERRYAIFPQQSGKLKIAPVIFNAQMIQTSRYRMSPFPQAGQSRRIQSAAIELNIKAKPGTQKDKAWLPARNIQLEEEWPQNPPKFKVGEAITRTLTLGADGLTAAQLPEIAVKTPEGFKAYPDQPLLNDQNNEDGIIGVRQEKIALIATKAGHYNLPEIKISWWNTKTQKREIARIAKRKIEVLAADGSAKPPISSSPLNISTANPANKLIKAPSPLTSAKGSGAAGFWPWLSLLLATGWLATAFILWRRNQHNTQAAIQTLDHKTKAAFESRKQAEKKIKQACMDNNTQASKEAILTWGKILYPEKSINSLSELGKHIGGTVANDINTLNQVLYSPSETTWQGQDLWDSIQDYNAGQKQTRPQKEDTLAPLYP